jgi:hypothetical protein
LSVFPSAWNISAPAGRIFMKFGIWVFYEKSVVKIQFSLKPDKNNGNTLHEDRYVYIYDNISHSSLRLRNVSDKSCRENQNTHFTSRTMTPPPPKKKIVPFVRYWDGFCNLWVL